MSPAGLRALDDVADEGVDPGRSGGAEQIDLMGREILGAEDPRAQGVVDVVVDVGDPVDELDDPPLQSRRLARARVVEDAVAHLLGQVEPAPVALQHLDHPQRVLVVLEARAAALAQSRVECLLARMPEGRMAEVVPQPDRLGQVLVEPEGAGDGAGDPAGLQRVGQPGSVVVALRRDEDLGLVLEPPEGLRVDDPVAVALERRADGTVGLLNGTARRVRAGRLGNEKLLLPGADPILERRRHIHPSILRPDPGRGGFLVSPALERPPSTRQKVALLTFPWVT